MQAVRATIEVQRSADIERDQAQPEAARFFNGYGRAEKHRDGVEAEKAVQCPFCRKWHKKKMVAIPHTDVGVADYIVSLRKKPGAGQPYSLACEVKGGGVAFPMNKIAEDQWKWMAEWEHDMNAMGWFWIQIGVDRINSVVNVNGKVIPNPFRRAVYLVPYTVTKMTLERILTATGGAQTVIYANDEVPHMKYGEAYRREHLFANEVWGVYRLFYNHGWELPAAHPFNTIYPDLDNATDKKGEEANGTG